MPCLDVGSNPTSSTLLESNLLVAFFYCDFNHASKQLQHIILLLIIMADKKKSFKELITGDKPVLVDFFAEWCGPCKMMPPILKELSVKLGDTIRIIKIDVDKNQELADALRIKGVPTLMIYKAGEMIWRQSGELDANSIITLVQQQI